MFIKVKKYEGQRVRWIQEKLDGHLIGIENADGLRVHTRTEGVDLWPKIENTHLCDTLVNLPKYSLILAELHGGEHSTQVKTLLNEASESLTITAFAMPLLGGHDYKQRSLSEVTQHLQDLGFEVPDMRNLETVRPLSSIEHDSLLEIAVNKNIEGFVLKEAHYDGWYKLKPVRTLDARVISAERSYSPNNYGGLGALNLALLDPDTGQWRVIGKCGSGFDQELRDTEDLAQFNDRVVEVSYDCIAQQGKLRFPRFIRFRDDKHYGECTIDQLDSN